MYETGSATNYRDLLEKLHAFLTTNGSAFGVAYDAGNTGDGKATLYRGGPSSVAEVFTLVVSDADIPGSEIWDITGSVTGMLGGTATTGEAFTDSHLALTITAGATNWAVGDTITINTAPKWTSRRHARGAVVSASGGTSGQYSMENVIHGSVTPDSSRYWSTSATPPVTLQFTLDAAATVAEYAMMAGYSGSYAPRSWTFEYWDGDSWEVLDTRSNVTSWATGEVKSFAVASPVSATMYRLNISAVNTTGYCQLGLVHLRESAGGIDIAQSQYIWEAPGNDGLSAILVGASAFQHVGADYFDWDLFAFDGFDAAARMHAQSNAKHLVYLPLWNTTIPYWFVADGRRVIVVAKLGSQYESAYLGFLEPFFTPSQMPYPMALGGSLVPSTSAYWDSTTFRYSASTEKHRAFPFADAATTAPVSGYVTSLQMHARRLDGTWRAFVATNYDATMTPNASDGWIWPYICGMTNLDVNVDGSYALFPIFLCDYGPNQLGQLSGCAAVAGQGLSAETLVTLAGVDWLVVPNINRTDKNDFFCVRLD